MIEIDHLTKRYGPHTAVEDLCLQVEPGLIYGLLGPNGAGKSTTMNMMTGCLAATEGTVRIDGYDIFEEPAKAKAKIGYLPEMPPVYPEMTPREYLSFVAEAKGVQKELRGGQLDQVLRVTDTAAVQNRLIRNLSKGYRQRVGIAGALLGDPEVIILDEPTVGLDPRQIIEIRDLIRTLGKKHTVILSSHILSEVRAVCDRIVIISKGHLVASDTPENLEQLFAGSRTLELVVRGEEPAIRAALAPLRGVRRLQFGRREEGEQSLTIETGPKDDLREGVFFACAAARLPILGMETRKASLEDVFIELTGQDAPLPKGEAELSDQQGEEGEQP